jgi:uncharacterized membrane-anchored protein YitT (DUF2179 family)
MPKLRDLSVVYLFQIVNFIFFIFSIRAITRSTTRTSTITKMLLFKPIPLPQNSFLKFQNPQLLLTSLRLIMEPLLPIQHLLMSQLMKFKPLNSKLILYTTLIPSSLLLLRVSERLLVMILSTLSSMELERRPKICLIITTSQ